MYDATAIPPPLQSWAAARVRDIERKLHAAGARPAAASGLRRHLLLVHLDGVARRLLQEAMASGAMPFLAGLVQGGASHFERAFWGTPASTPAFQAGLLYGMRHPNLPAYEWFDRGLGRRIKMNTPGDAAAVEARLATRDSLLSGGGHTYFSLFRGQAQNQLCMSALGELKRLKAAAPYEFEGLSAVRQQPLAHGARWLAREGLASAREVAAWARAVGDWRHEGLYLVSRVLLQRLGWSFATHRALLDMVRGVPRVYLVYGNYDEVAHRRGPRSAQALAELHALDAQLRELCAVARAVRTPYDVVLVSDHGHVDSAPLERRAGVRLERLLREGPVPPLPDAVVQGLRDGRPLARVAARPLEGDPVVVESGNFAHVYLTRAQRPLEALELLQLAPEVLARAQAHPDVGLVTLRRGEGAVALVQGGVYGPDDVHRAPLAPAFNRTALADSLRELPHLPTAGDLVLYGQAVGSGPHVGTVGFAWEFGSHGGLTATETDSLVLWPADAPLDLSSLTHSVQLHERLSEVYRQ